MSTEKLRKPVAEIKCHEDLSLSVVNVRDGFSLGRHPVYSQEYVSALLAELEAKDKRIAELEGQLQSGFTPEALAQEERAENAEQRVAELEAKTAMTMGVGSGNGNLFVHGDYDSIKAAQAIVLENESLRAKLATPVQLPALLHPESDAVNGMIFANGRNEAIAECSIAIRQAGFLSEASPMTVEGDEQ